jgi:hypothetical protein
MIFFCVIDDVLLVIHVLFLDYVLLVIHVIIKSFFKS